jgi:PRD domain protein (TIGR03582 family)
VSAAVDTALATLAADMPIADEERSDVTTVVDAVEELMTGWGLPLSDERRLALTAHSLAFVRRIRTRDQLPEIDLDDFPEIPENTVSGLRAALIPYCSARESELADEEVFLFAMHVEVARLIP